MVIMSRLFFFYFIFLYIGFKKFYVVHSWIPWPIYSSPQETIKTVLQWSNSWSKKSEYQVYVISHVTRYLKFHPSLTHLPQLLLFSSNKYFDLYFLSKSNAALFRIKKIQQYSCIVLHSEIKLHLVRWILLREGVYSGYACPFTCTRRK